MSDQNHHTLPWPRTKPKCWNRYPVTARSQRSLVRSMLGRPNRVVLRLTIMQRHIGFGLSLCVALLTASCGGSHRAPLASPRIDLGDAKPTTKSPVAEGPVKRTGTLGATTADPKVIDLDTIRIQVVRKGPGGEPDMTAVATTDLFNQAVDASKNNDGNRALGLFRQLVIEFPDSNFAPLSLFNVAAIFDGRGDLNMTLATLAELNEKYPHARKSVEGHLYMVALLAEHDRFAEALTAVDTLLARDNLTYADHVEAYARKGYVQIELGQLDTADATFEKAISAWKQIPNLDDVYFIAMAFYYRGELVHRKFNQLPVRLPDTQLRKDLDAKEALASAAYDKWKSGLGFRHAYWATASGYQMSQIFVEFWRATVTAPYPTTMDVKARDHYVKEVHARVRAHLEKALEGHQMNVELANAYGVETMWSKASKERATEILTILGNEDRGTFVRP
jgi:tetratricopeptide (TPR) repeat protein